MTEDHVLRNSKKVIRSFPGWMCKILCSSYSSDNIIRKYSEYKHGERKHYINDFVNKKSYLSWQLSDEEVSYLHENNLNNARVPAERQRHTDDVSTDVGILLCNSNIPNVINEEAASHLTSEYLDRLGIPAGRIQYRRCKFYKWSNMLHSVLNCHIGSERLVTIRRLVIKSKYKYLGLEPSGSRAEGLNMIGSDTDLMIIFGGAFEGEGGSGFTGCTFDSTRIYPYAGYTMIDKFVNGQHIGHVSSSVWKTDIREKLPFVNDIFAVGLHGPSIFLSPFKEDMDIVPCLACSSWPEIAREWRYRERKYGWPSMKLISKIIDGGCHIVPVSYNSRLTDNNESDWRLSFSMAEKMLIVSFNHTQFLTYSLLKLFLSEVIKKDESIRSDLMCSYFFKTVIFWTIEETDPALWSSSNIIYCFFLCLDRFYQCVIDGNCSNYFVRCSNLFDNRFHGSDKESLIKLLFSIQGGGIYFIYKMQTLHDLCPDLDHPITNEEIQDLANEQRECTLELLHLRSFQRNMLNAIPQFTKSWLNVEEHRIFLRKIFKATYRRSITKKDAIQFLCLCMNISKTNNNNKYYYALHRLFIQLLCYSSTSDIASGKALLATWLYKQGRFEDSLKVIDFTLEQKHNRRYHCGINHASLCQSRLPELTNVDFSVTLRFFSDALIYIPCNSPLMLLEFHRLNEIGSMQQSSLVPNIGMIIYPDLYINFLKFLNCHRLNRIEDRERALIDMIDVDVVGTEPEIYAHHTRKQLLMSLANVLKNDLGRGYLQRDNYLRYLQENSTSLGFNMANFSQLFPAPDSDFNLRAARIWYGYN